MVYARALRALECITHAGSSPVLGTHISSFLGQRSIVPIKVYFMHGESCPRHTSECSAVGSAPRLGRGGPRFEPGHSDLLLCVDFLAKFCKNFERRNDEAVVFKR